MTTGVLYWRKKDKKTGKWTYEKVKLAGVEIRQALQEEE